MSYTLLIILTTVLVLVFVGALIILVTQIHKVLYDIGGCDESFLAKLRVGLRAIEMETSHLPPQATQLNEALEKTGAGLNVINQHLEGTIQAALQQKNV